MLKFSLGKNITRVYYCIKEIGEDLEISIYGGDKHIGAIGVVSDGVYNILSIKKNKEFELIQPLANKLKKYNDMNILIIAGIQIEDITLDEIREIVENHKIAIEKIDKYICSEYEMFHEFN